MQANATLQKNLSVMAKGRPYLFRVLNELPETATPLLARKTLPEPAIEALENCKILVIHGFDDGLADWLSQHGMRFRQILIIEAEPQRVRSALQKCDFTEWLAKGSFEILAGLKGKDLEAALIQYLRTEFRITLTRSIGHLCLSLALSADSIVETKRILENAIQAVFAANQTLDEDNYIGLDNILANQNVMARAPHVDSFRGLFEGKPGLVISAGPSLDLHLEFLKAYQDRFVIVATDGSLVALIKNKIRPSFVVTLERTLEVHKMLDEIPAEWNVPVILLPSIHPAALKKKNFTPVILLRGATFGAWFWPGKIQFEIGSNVAAMAIRFLSFGRARSIALLGQDLAYDRQTANSHYAGQDTAITAFEKSILETKEFYCELEGNNGVPIASQALWDMFRKEIEYLISIGRIQTQNVIPAERGAKIANAVRVDPATFWQEAQSLPVLNIKQDVQAQLAAYVPEAGRLQQIKETIVRLENMHRLATESVQTITRGDLENMPVTYNEAEMQAIRLHYAQSKKLMLSLMESDPDLFFNLIGCFLYPKTVQTLYDLENNQCERGKEPDYCERETLLIHGWFKDVSHWTQRAMWLMRRALK